MLVGAQVRHEAFESAGHVEKERGRDFPQIADRFFERAGHGTAVVDVERAAVVDGEADIVIAAESVIPRGPIDEDRRFVDEERQAVGDHLLIAAPHSLRVDHALRHPGRAGSEKEFDDGIAVT